MKKLTAFVLLTSLIISTQAVGKTITFATEPAYPPFEMTTETGDLVGFDIDIAKAICNELGATCQFKTQNFDTLIADLKHKKFDAAISAMDITEARSKQVLFSDPYYDSSASFLALNGKATPETAKIVGVQNGSTFQQYLTQNAKQYTLKPYANLQTAMLDLKSGRIEMIFGDSPVLAEWLKTESDLTFVGEKVVDPTFFGSGYGIAVNKANSALIAQFNQALKAIKANGKYEQIYQTWMAVK